MIEFFQVRFNVSCPCRPFPYFCQCVLCMLKYSIAIFLRIFNYTTVFLSAIFSCINTIFARRLAAPTMFTSCVLSRLRTSVCLLAPFPYLTNALASPSQNCNRSRRRVLQSFLTKYPGNIWWDYTHHIQYIILVLYAMGTCIVWCQCCY